jgi:hypothetical protein
MLKLRRLYSNVLPDSWWPAIIVLIIGIGLLGLCCYHFGYVNGYVDAIAWAKGVRWDQ